jgi:hypothetical protein
MHAPVDGKMIDDDQTRCQEALTSNPDKIAAMGVKRRGQLDDAYQKIRRGIQL